MAKSAVALKVVPASSKQSAIDAVTLDARSAASILDHTLLEPGTTRAQVERLCDEAKQHGFHSVCVSPSHLTLAVGRLRGSGVKVTTVVGCASGASLTTVKRFEASEALRIGASELEMVLNIGALKSGDSDLVRADVRGVADICHASGGKLKVIIETGLLNANEKTLACELALAGGADCIVTSAHDHESAPTVADVILMRRVVGNRIGVKAAGTVRDPELLRALVAAGASRVGTSAAVDVVRGFAASA